MPKLIATTTIKPNPMCVSNTPIEHYPEYNLWVKREDLSCPPPGPAFSKARGVYAHILKRPEPVIGVLDTRHSQAGHAVARACQLLGKRCINFYPEFKHEPGPRAPQEAAQALGAELVGLPAGRSAILYHAARKQLGASGYLMPNALKLQESVTETAKEVPDKWFDYVLIPISSGTIAAGVIRGFDKVCREQGTKSRPIYIIHMGYTRSHDEVIKYLVEKSGVSCEESLWIEDEKYAYKDEARKGETPPWPCNSHYDLKAFRWWHGIGPEASERHIKQNHKTLLWNIG